LKKKLITQKAYILFYKKRGFKLETREDFESIEKKSTGKMDHLIEVTGYVKSYAELEKENEAKKKEEEKREGGDKKEKD